MHSMIATKEGAHVVKLLAMRLPSARAYYAEIRKGCSRDLPKKKTAYHMQDPTLRVMSEVVFLPQTSKQAWKLVGLMQTPGRAPAIAPGLYNFHSISHSILLDHRGCCWKVN